MFNSVELLSIPRLSDNIYVDFPEIIFLPGNVAKSFISVVVI